MSTTVLYQRPHLKRELGDELLLLASDAPPEAAPARLNRGAVELWLRFRGGAALGDVLDASGFDQGDADPVIDHLIEQELITTEWTPAQEVSDFPAHLAPPNREDGSIECHSFEELRRFLATYGVIDATRPLDVTSYPDLPALIDRVEREGSLGQFCEAVRLGWLISPDQLNERAHERWAANQVHCLKIEAMLLRAVRLLDEAGLEHRVLKGVAVAHLDYPNPAIREFGDADILLEDHAYTQGVAVLADGGCFENVFDGVTHAFSDLKGVTFRYPNGILLDVHRRLAIGAIGIPAPTRLFDSGQDFYVGGTRLRGPSKTGRLVHATMHEKLSTRLVGQSTSVRPGTWRDVAQIGPSPASDVTFIASEMRATGAVRSSLRQLGAEYLGLPWAKSLAEGLSVTTVERLLTSEKEGWSYGNDVFRREVAGVLLTSGVVGKWRYLKPRLFPNAEFRKIRGVTWRSYVEIVVRTFRNTTKRFR